MTFRCHSVCKLCVNFQDPVAFRKLRLLFSRAKRCKMQNFDRLLANVIKEMTKTYSLLQKKKKTRDFEIISVSSLFRFNYLLFIKSHFVINSAYLNTDRIK